MQNVFDLGVFIGVGEQGNSNISALRWFSAMESFYAEGSVQKGCFVGVVCSGVHGQRSWGGRAPGVDGWEPWLLWVP